MTYVNDSGTMENINITSDYDNNSMYYDYEAYDVWEYRENSFKITLIVFAVLVAILVTCDVILFLTCLSPAARARSASWYLYHMVAMAVINGVIVIPAEHFEIDCRFGFLLSRVVPCVRGINMVLISIEIMATILAPRTSWERSRKFRFFFSSGMAWLFSIVLVSLILREHYGQCFIYGSVEIILFYIIKTWVPGILILGLSIAAIVVYNRARSNGAYDQVSENSESPDYRREWFICLLVVNSQYIVLDIILWEIHMVMFVDSVNALVLMIITNLVVYVMPSAMLVLHDVRLALKQGLVAICEFLRRLGRCESRSPTDSSQNVILDMDAINDQSL